MLSSGEKLILKPFGGCGDAGLCQEAFAELGYKSVYSNRIDMIELADLVFLPGGADVDPTRYGGTEELSFYSFTSMLDRWEVKVIPRALELNIPIFGICRGHQTLWVELGGKLEQHITPRHSGIRRRLGGHLVGGEWGSAVVNSLHHQAPDYPIPEGAVIRMLAPDGTIEAFTYGDHAVCVQWHPEMMPHHVWKYLMIAAINGEANSIPSIYGRKELQDGHKDYSPYSLAWEDGTVTDADDITSGFSGRVWPKRNR